MIKLLRIPTREITTRGAHIRHKKGIAKENRISNLESHICWRMARNLQRLHCQAPQLKGFTVSQQMVKL
ncbi:MULTISPECIES: hypothetical protein [Enterobacteriaceae]|uniref:hypothetical protein n=1 Tax=Enterobacteriaceae TaxID=543 RepID=UPI00027C33A9|nr:MULTISPECIES: hypothetical protein [Enterobacteriaceae]MDV1392288.1 hypothetical protein [Raoultella ornithinolytica]BBS14649.1 hypothetical protein WP5W18C01_P10630 [Klebsiella aerogenes]EJU30427.1 hypothetical protein HMPREF1144_4602 [Klebsiella sp. OBRC7]MCE7434459.1 hypothetical protein [Klebsiella pneumoniae]MCK2103317.1 hypothetical protein [Klebsiella michiganensis]